MHWFRAESPSVRDGWLVVLRVDPSRVRPTDTAMPVLYAGTQTVEPINFGHADGVVVGLVPAVDDLAGTQLWFGEPDLPEQVDAAEIERQRERARSRGWLALDRAAVDAARGNGGEELVLASRLELEHVAALTILEHAPGDRDRAEGLLPQD